MILQLFRDDIKYLLSMQNLWKKRKPPVPLERDHLPSIGKINLKIMYHVCRKELEGLKLKFVLTGEETEGGIRDQKVWSVAECAQVLETSVNRLKEDLSKQGDGGMLVWDKVIRISICFLSTCEADLKTSQCIFVGWWGSHGLCNGCCQYQSTHLQHSSKIAIWHQM